MRDNDFSNVYVRDYLMPKKSHLLQNHRAIMTGHKFMPCLELAQIQYKACHMEKYL